MEIKKNINKILLGFKIGGLEIAISSGIREDMEVDDFVELVASILDFLIGFSAVVAVIFIVLGGYTFITAQGEPDKVSKGGNMIMGAIVGMAIAFVAKLLITYLVDEILLK